MAEKFDLENFPISESAKRMLGYVTQGFYDRSYVGKWIYQVIGLEYDQARKIAEELQEQMFPETATWGLAYHEIKWGLPVRDHLSYEERRKLIYQKRDYRAPITPYRMEKYLEDVTGFEVHVADVNDPGAYGFMAVHPNIFHVYFMGDGTLDKKAAYKGLNHLKQSHTLYKMSERVETELDHRGLEQMVLIRIMIYITAPFWEHYILNGAWRLDGSILMNARKRYDLKHGLKLYGGGRKAELLSDLRLVKIRSGGCICQETAQVAICRIHTAVRSGDPDSAARVRIHFGIEQQAGSEIGLMLETRRNVWHLDGQVALDGSRIMNAIDRKEIL